MQYKIPVQIENEDKIFLNLSLRQLAIIMVGFSIAYTVFKSLEKNFDSAVALFPSGLIAFLTVFVAVFKTSEMTFVPFILNLIRLQINGNSRIWFKWIDSYSQMEIWYVPPENSLAEKMQTKKHKQIHDDILSKI